MSTEAAIHVHADLRRTMLDVVPRQVMVDDFWIAVNRDHQEHTKSNDAG